MMTATMTTSALVQLNITISRELDAAEPGSDESRRLIRERRRVRDQLEARRAAESN